MATNTSIPIPADEQERLQSILNYDILDTANDEQLDELTVLAANIFNVPIVLITLIDQKRQWFKSNYGLTIKETKRSISFCQYTIMGNEILEVPNALEDERFVFNELVTSDPHIRYYCGAPLVNEKGYRMGSLALIDRVPRQLEAEQKKILQLLAQQVINFFELNAKRKELKNDKLHLEERVSQRTHELEKNIRALQQRDEKLSYSEKRLIQAQRIAKIGSWEYEVASDQLTASDALYELLNLNKYSNALDTLDDYFRLVHPEDIAQLQEDFQHFIQTGEGNQMEYRLWLPAGDIKFILSVGDLQTEADGKVSKIWGISQDISERKLAEQAIQQHAQQLKSYSQQLEEANASKDKFFSLIAHDLQSPVNGVIGSADLLAHHLQGLNAEEVRILAEGIYSSASHLSKLLKNLLEWARSQTGGMNFTPIPINLRRLATEVTGLLNENAQKKELQVINMIGGEVVLKADRNMLHSVLRNLLANAIKFSNTVGKITLSCQTTPTHLQISVTDTGIGMSKKVQGQLFHMESKYTSPGTANERGTGLGLLLCKEFVEKHRGSIWVESEEGKGTTFTFTLPVWLPGSD
ncbi:MAG: ATP-binding protein [Bacteroidota bacterium]